MWEMINGLVNTKCSLESILWRHYKFQFAGGADSSGWEKMQTKNINLSQEQRNKDNSDIQVNKQL